MSIPIRRGVIFAALASFTLLGTAAQAPNHQLAAGAGNGANAQGRTLTVRDLFNAESIGRSYGGSVAYSHDGRHLALVKLRAAATKRDYSVDYFYNNDLGDVWVKTGGGEIENITNGAQDKSGWWAPQWSPDGRYLAMLSTRGSAKAGDVSLWVWERQARSLRRVTEANVVVGSGNIFAHAHPYLWWDAKHLLCPLLAPGESNADREQAARRAASNEWGLAAKGNVVTASVLEAGATAEPESARMRSLIRINVGSGERQEIARGTTLSWQPSAQRGHVAFARRVGTYKPAGGELLLNSPEQYVVDVVSMAGKVILSSQGMADDLIAGTMRWSSSGMRLAFLSFARQRTAPPELVIMDLEKLRIQKVELQGLDLSVEPLSRRNPGEWLTDIEWLKSGELLVRGVERRKGAGATAPQRRDWWRLSLSGARKNVTRAMQHVPPKLWRRQNDDVFVGLAGDAIWVLEPLHASARPLKATPNEPVREIVWPSQSFGSEVMQYARVGQGYPHVYVTARGDRDKLYRVDLNSEQAIPVQLPEDEASFLGATQASEEVLLVRNDFAGLKVWHSKNDRTELLIDANAYLKEIAPAKLRKVDYVSLDGAALTGWILLPPDYVEGRLYPLIASVYATRVMDELPPARRMTLHTDEIAAARGYAVLMPSMPAGDGTDPMLELTNGVLPAVDKAIAIGIADPRRLFLMGISWGGFSTNALITQTRRFAAAASVAGPTNFETLYGDFPPNVRYAPTLDLFEPKSISMELLLGGTPWTNRAGYVRNSPVTYVDRVHTPLLLLHGDLDFIPIQQAEQFFYALHRQGKKARFVRYMGEGHIPAAPANVEHMWTQIFDWFEEAGAKRD